MGQWQHSRSFTPYEYRALGMPYFHLLPFTKSHQWEATCATTTTTVRSGKPGVTMSPFAGGRSA